MTSTRTVSSNSYTPRHLRKGGDRRNGSVGPEKKMQFRKVKAESDKFIHRSASSLEGDNDYLVWCSKADRGSLRAGK